jgi:hypothetical protein
MWSSVENDAAARAEQVSPAGGIAALVEGVFGQIGPLAQRTVDCRPYSFGTTCGIQYPLSKLERRTMPYVLAVPARERSHPVALLVLVVAADRSPHGCSVSRCPIELLTAAPRTQRSPGKFLVNPPLADGER